MSLWNIKRAATEWYENLNNEQYNRGQTFNQYASSAKSRDFCRGDSRVTSSTIDMRSEKCSVSNSGATKLSMPDS